MINLALESFKYESASAAINGEEIYNIAKFGSENPARQQEFYDKKYTEFGLFKPTNGTFRKYLQRIHVEVLNELGIPFEYYNGAAIDGSVYHVCAMKTPEFTAENYASWLLSSFLLKLKGFDITESSLMRENSFMGIQNRRIQQFDRLRRKHNSSVPYASFIGKLNEKIFAPMRTTMENEYYYSKFEIEDIELEYIDYSQMKTYSMNNHSMDERSYVYLQQELLKFNFGETRLEVNDVIVFSKEMFLRVQKNQDGKYDLFSITDNKVVGTFNMKVMIEVMLHSFNEHLSKALFSGEAGSAILIAPGENYQFFHS